MRLEQYHLLHSWIKGECWSTVIQCVVARCDSLHVLLFLVITLSLVLVLSAYYSVNCDGQLFVKAVKIGTVT